MTNETAISHRQNRILQVLTVLTVVFLPITFVTNLFGMNVPVPWAESGPAFILILVSLMVTVVSLLGLARWLRWL